MLTGTDLGIFNALPPHEAQKVDGQTYYRTKDRLFVLRTSEDAQGPYPVWAFVGRHG